MIALRDIPLKGENITTLPPSAYLYMNADLGKYLSGKYLTYLSHLKHANAPFYTCIVILARFCKGCVCVCTTKAAEMKNDNKIKKTQ